MNISGKFDHTPFRVTAIIAETSDPQDRTTKACKRRPLYGPIQLNIKNNTILSLETLSIGSLALMQVVKRVTKQPWEAMHVQNAPG
uniref:Uncharacterized protein n=1 Tax=Romanomermis culicivorax TaxID=13658 RepID=A0A915KZH3_ROMCU